LSSSVRSDVVRVAIYCKQLIVRFVYIYSIALRCRAREVTQSFMDTLIALT